jgi:surface antigen
VPPAARAAANAAEYQRARQELQGAQAAVTELTGRLQAADRDVAAAEQRVANDLHAERALRLRIGRVARSAYQTEGSQLSGILEAQSIGQLWDALAELRVVSERQEALVAQLDRMRRADDDARDQARANREWVARQRVDAQAHVAAVEARLTSLAAALRAAGQVLSGRAGRVPAQRLPQTTGADGQCTWYAEQAWATYSDPASPTLSGDGSDVVSNLAQASGRPVQLEPQPGALVSWRRPLLSPYGHVAYVASVDHDPAGRVTGYTVWEMNYVGPFVTDTRLVPWTGPTGSVQFMGPPAPVDPVAGEVARFGAGS